MPYRDDVEALHRHVEAVTAERDEARAQLERARAALASVVADMAGLPAEADIPWRSLHGGEPRDVVFVNATRRKVALAWVSYDGRTREEVTLVPDGERAVSTFVAHLWRVSDAETGEVVLQRYVRVGDARILVHRVDEHPVD